MPMDITLTQRKVSANTQSRLRAIDWGSIAAFALPFLLYLLTLAPTVYNLDSAEFTVAAATGGIVRATGYPLYLLLGRLWSLLPLGDVGYRMNLFSAVAGALTIALAERILRRLQVGPWARLGALGLLASAPYFWSLSLIAEVYTLHTALMAGLILLLLRWADDPTPGRLAQVALVFGLSAGNHAASILLVPGVAWYVLTVAPWRVLKPQAILAALLALLAGLSVYLYLPIRHAAAPAFNYAGTYDAAGQFQPVDLQTPAGLWWLVSGRTFAGEMLAYQGHALWKEISRFAVQLWRSFLFAGVGPGLVGMIVLLRRDWRLGGMALAMFLSNAAFYIDYRVVDKNTMFLPAYLVWALWLGVGLQSLLDWVRKEDHRRVRHWGTRILQGLIAATVLLAIGLTWPRVDLSGDYSARQRGEMILQQAPENALVFGWWETVPLIQYLQLVEGQRPDVQAVSRFLISPEDMAQLIEQEISRRPVLIDTASFSLPSGISAQRFGAIYQLTPTRRYSPKGGVP